MIMCITYGSRQFALFLPDPQNADAQQKKGKLRLPFFDNKHYLPKGKFTN